MIRDEQIATLMGAGALALLLGALGFQYFAHLPPCEMCHWQRWPYFAAAIIGLVGTFVWKWDTRLLAAVTIAVVAALSLMVQMQNGFFVALAAIALIVVSFLNQGSRTLAVMTVLLVFVSGLIGAYQAGMQWGFLPGPSACTVTHPYVLGSGAPEPEISCNVVTWSLFGLSLAAYNALISFALTATGCVLLRRSHAA
jgi:disulfide bond formation protein DsbB